MKLASISVFASLLALSSAAVHTSAVTVVCTDSDPVTVTETKTVTYIAPCAIIPPLKTQIITSSAPAAAVPSVTTKDGSITSVSTSGTKTSVWVYPTGDCPRDATVSIWVDNIVVEVIIININVTIINGATTTIYSTKTDAPKWTPTPPPANSNSLPSKTSSSASASRTPVIHKVVVGIDGTLAYGANQINATVGDIIRFDFNSTNHTVTQSDFLTPCSPKAGGFNTGFNQSNPSNHTGVIFKDFVVPVSTPLWFYCAQTVKASHCHKGMVLGVNPDGKFPAFLSMATATATAISSSTPSAVGTGGLPIGTGKIGAISTSVGKPFGTGISSVGMPLYTAARPGASSTGSFVVVAPKPTSTFVSEHINDRRAAKPWFA